MPQALEKMSEQITEKWNLLNKTQKIRIGVLFLIILLSIGMAMYLSTKSPWIKLIGDSQPGDTKLITDKLTEGNITYKVENDATEIFVKEKDKSNATMILAEAGFPKTTYDFSSLITEKSDLGMTESERHTKYQYALENEIAKMIASYSQVDEAKVKLVLPEDTDFLNKNQEAKSSVVLKINSPLSQKQAQGIAHLVSSSVKGLVKEKVTIIANDKMIFGMDDQEFGDIANDRFALQKMKEKDIENKIKDILIGYDDVRVAAQLKLDFNPEQKEETNYSPVNPETGEGAVVEKQTKKESLKNGDESLSPGINENPAEVDQYPQGVENASEYKNQEENTKIVWGEKKTQTSKALGEVVSEQSSIAITIFKEKIYNEEDLENAGQLSEKNWSTYKNDIEAQEAFLTVDPQIIEQIKGATGINNVTVVAKEKPVFVDKVISPIPVQNYIPVAIALLLIGLIAFVIIKRTQPEEEFISEPELSVEEMLAAAQAAENIETIDYDENGSEVKKQIDRFVDEKPEAVAQLLRNWLSEEWE